MYLSIFVKYLCCKNSNSEEIITQFPNLITNLVNNIANAGRPEFQIEKQILKNELEAFVKIIGENFKTLIDNNILPENDIKAICDLYIDDPDYGEKLKDILKSLAEIDEEQHKIQSLKKNVKFL